MSDQTKEQATEHEKKTEIKVTVTFALASRKPYQAEVSSETTLETVRASAMDYFGVSDDETTHYDLTFEGSRPDLSTTVGELAGKAKALKLTLSKELIQG